MCGLMQVEAEPLTKSADFIDLACFDGHYAAEYCRAELEKHGIESQIYDERNVQTFIFLTQPKASFKVLVKSADYSRAAELLIELEKADPQVATLVYSCPECGSFAVEYPQFSRKFITPLFMEWMSNLGVFKKLCYCRKCHATWPRTVRKGVNPKHLHPDSSVLVPPPA